MVPEHPPPSRGGIEAGLRGARNRGPGCYGPSPVSEANVQSNACTELSLAWPDRFFPCIGWGKKGLVQLQ